MSKSQRFSTGTRTWARERVSAPTSARRERMHFIIHFVGFFSEERSGQGKTLPTKISLDLVISDRKTAFSGRLK